MELFKVVNRKSLEVLGEGFPSKVEAKVFRNSLLKPTESASDNGGECDFIISPGRDHHKVKERALRK